jgi:spermidine/putrescine-binding protein
VREVVGAALIATGHGPNETSQAALEAARALLAQQRPSVVRYGSDDFITPVLSGEVGIQHAWSGPAVWGTRRRPRLRYVVPDEGAIVWITAASIPANAPDSVASTALLRGLMDPDSRRSPPSRTGFRLRTRRHGAFSPTICARTRACSRPRTRSRGATRCTTSVRTSGYWPPRGRPVSDAQVYGTLCPHNAGVLSFC